MVILHLLAVCIYTAVMLYTPSIEVLLVGIVGIFYSAYRSGRIVQAALDSKELQRLMMEARKEVYQFIQSYGAPGKPEEKLIKD